MHPTGCDREAFGEGELPSQQKTHHRLVLVNRLVPMATQIVVSQPSIAQAPTNQTPQKGVTTEQVWMGASFVLLLLLIGLSILYQRKSKQFEKKLRMEQFRNRELQKKYKMALSTISKMEKNPDLVHSRDFNLDYLRMRMAEEQFNTAIVNQIKAQVNDKFRAALRPKPETKGKARMVDEVFDVTYQTDEYDDSTKGVLFRIEIKLAKLPTQTTSSTIQEVTDCIEAFLRPGEEAETWQPTIQGRMAYMHWDQKAKPTPLLVLEQTQEGMNVTIRTKPGEKQFR
jgi:hypothetical protein